MTPRGCPGAAGPAPASSGAGRARLAAVTEREPA